eukprot:1394302-Amorphochlora_amoeboformis.AAC.1
MVIGPQAARILALYTMLFAASRLAGPVKAISCRSFTKIRSNIRALPPRWPPSSLFRPRFGSRWLSTGSTEDLRDPFWRESACQGQKEGSNPRDTEGKKGRKKGGERGDAASEMSLLDFLEVEAPKNEKLMSKEGKEVLREGLTGSIVHSLPKTLPEDRKGVVALDPPLPEDSKVGYLTFVLLVFCNFFSRFLIFSSYNLPHCGIMREKWEER